MLVRFRVGTDDGAVASHLEKLRSADACIRLHQGGQGILCLYIVSWVEDCGRLPQLVHAQCKQEDAWTRWHLYP